MSRNGIINNSNNTAALDTNKIFLLLLVSQVAVNLFFLHKLSQKVIIKEWFIKIRPNANL
jgi:hypothetical protein